MPFNDLPVGEPSAPIAPSETPHRQPPPGRSVPRAPGDPGADAAELFAASHGDAATERLWTYMTSGPFASVEAMHHWLQRCQTSTDPLFFTVIEQANGRRVGMVSFLNVVPGMRRLELGNIWYAPQAQRTQVNTESIYLMLCETFDRLHYRRAEWKCDALNARSRAAAQRLGFSFEGIFRQHMIVRARNRDTAWFAMLDGDWPAIKANCMRWLYGEEPGLSLRALNADLLRPPAI